MVAGEKFQSASAEQRLQEFDSEVYGEDDNCKIKGLAGCLRRRAGNFGDAGTISIGTSP